jgi:hypothetical protein
MSGHLRESSGQTHAAQNTKQFKILAWRIDGIPIGVTKGEFLTYFEEYERARVTVKTLCPSIGRPRLQCATITYQHDASDTANTPQLRREFCRVLRLDRDFFMFTPLYLPPSEQYTVE